MVDAGHPARRQLAVNILGSCVTRGPICTVSDDVEVLEFRARTSVQAMMAPRVEGVAERMSAAGSDVAEHPFERRCVVQDLEKTWQAVFAGAHDVVILDFIDERYGVGIRGSDVVTWSTCLERLLGPGRLEALGFRWLPATSGAFIRRLRAALPGFCERISDHRNILVNEAVWTATYEDGTSLAPRMMAAMEKQNALLELIYEELARRTRVQFLGVDRSLLLAKRNHRFGEAPFHYCDESETMLGGLIARRVREMLGASRTRALRPAAPVMRKHPLPRP